MFHEITLRLSAHHLAQLRERAGDLPVEEAAWELLVEALAGEAVTERVGAHYQRFEAQLADLRRDLSISTQGLLVLLGRVPPDDARLWAKNNLG
jgi:hypothetical protein